MIEKIKKHFKKIIIALLGIFTLTAAAATVLMVPQGGTGINSLTAGSYMKGAGTGAFVARTPAEVKTDLTLNLVENTALSTWAGTTNVTTIGTLIDDLNFVDTDRTIGTNVGVLEINEEAEAGVSFFSNAITGENEQLRVYGYGSSLGTPVLRSGQIYIDTYGGFVFDTISSATVLFNNSNLRVTQGDLELGRYDSDDRKIRFGAGADASILYDGANLRVDPREVGSGSLVVNSGIHLAEITTPTAVTNYGAFYTKSDNKPYFQDGAGTEHEIELVNGYAEAYTYDNAVATVIETADTPIALRVSTAGLMDKFTFDAGSTGAITSYTDYSGTVAGTVLVTDVGHGLATDDIITIRGTTNYNGVFQMTYVSADTFYIIDTWVADDGASDWDQPGHVIYNGADTEIFSVVGQVSVAPAAACRLTWKLYVNATPQNKSTVEREFAVNDLDTTSTSCLVSLSTGDMVWLSVQSDSTNDITIKHGEFNAHRL